MTNPKIDAKYLEIMESMGLALEVKQTPLLIMSELDQATYVEQLSALVGGVTVFSTADDAQPQILESFSSATYLFLHIEEPMNRQVQETVHYYLDTRDTLSPASDSKLQSEFKAHPIHADHRMILLMDLNVFKEQDTSVRRRLSEYCTVNATLASP